MHRYVHSAHCTHGFRKGTAHSIRPIRLFMHRYELSKALGKNKRRLETRLYLSNSELVSKLLLPCQIVEQLRSKMIQSVAN